MTAKEELFAHVCREVIVGVVREDNAEEALAVAQAYRENGIRTLEITFTTPDAADIMSALVRAYPDLVIAAGTVRNPNDAAAARRAGARILVSPHTDTRVIEYATEHDLLVIAGAATPTEIIRAWEAGADIVKVYPAPHLGGPDYIRTIKGPIRDIPMLAGGPVTLDAIESYLEAGAVAVNLGGSLAVPDLVRARKWDEIGKRALLACSIVQARRDDAMKVSSGTVH